MMNAAVVGVLVAMSATLALEQLISELGERESAIERVVSEWQGSELAQAAGSPKGTPQATALAVTKELAESWGPTADPSWVDKLVPGRSGEDGSEVDLMFSVYRRPGLYAYARLRGDASDRPSYMRLIVGIVRMPANHQR